MGGMSVEKKQLQVNGGAIETDENQIRDFISNGGLLIDRGYTSHQHFTEVGLIHMNGRLYDPLLRRFLNADENIQDMFNTQNYNKYGYVLNNPLMYNDPSGEFIWFVIAAAAVIGGYTAGVKANGSWNPFKWDWKKTGLKILGGTLVGAVSGATGAWAGQAAAAFAAGALGIEGGILGGAIAGFVGGAIGGTVSGVGNALVFGESVGRAFVKGFISGAISGAIIGGAVGGIQTLANNAKALNPSEMRNVITGKSVAEGRSVWSLNNTPKHIEKPTSTVGKISKIGKLEVGEMTGEFERTVGYKYNPQTEAFEEVTNFQNQNPFIITKDGVVLPRNAYIPDNLVESPFRSNSYGIFENGKFIEKIRIDAGTPAGFKGPNSSHFHIDGKSKHIFDGTKWPYYKK